MHFNILGVALIFIMQIFLTLKKIKTYPMPLFKIHLLQIVLLIGCLLTVPAFANDVQVTGSYIEVHTGPGRGFPIFHVVEQGDIVRLIKRKTSWYQVRTADGKMGWVSLEHMERTMMIGTQTVPFEQVSDAIEESQKIELGIASGWFADGSVVSLMAHYRIFSSLSAEMTFAQSMGTFSSSRLYYAGIMIEFFPHWLVVPYFVSGFGYLKNVPSDIVAGGKEFDQTIANSGLGVRFKLGYRFYLRTTAKMHFSLDGDKGQEGQDSSNQYFDFQVGLSAYF